MDLKDTIIWCIQNNVEVAFVSQEGVLCIKVENGNISSTRPIPEEFGPEELGETLLTVLHDVEYGTRFHQENGMFPPPPKRRDT